MAYRRRRPREKSLRLLGYRSQFVHYACREPRATLVCFHGWLDNAASFAPLADELKDYEIYAWDFLGHGKSEHKHAGERYHYIDLVPFIDAAWNSVSARRKVLVGHSMGAGACSLYAGAEPKAVRELVLIEGFSPMTAESSEAAKILHEGIVGLKTAQELTKPKYETIDDAVKVRMRINALSHGAALPLVKRATVQEKGRITWRADFRLRAPSLMRMTSEQVKNILEAIEARVLVVLGEQGMPQLAQAAGELGSMIRNMQLVKLPGHHHLHMEKSGVGEAIVRFLE